MFDSSGGDVVEIFHEYRPKFDYNGVGHKWYCEACCRSGSWTSEPEARAQGKQHDDAKHAAVAEGTQAAVF